MSESKLYGVRLASEATAALLKRMHSEELRKALIPAGRILYQGAYRRAPYDPGREKGTHLRDALFVDARDHGKGMDILVGINHRKAPHAHLFELGWSRKPEGHPFLRPAAVEEEELIKKAVADGVRRVAEESAALGDALDLR